MPTKGLFARSLGTTPGSARLLFVRGFLGAVGVTRTSNIDAWVVRRHRCRSHCRLLWWLALLWL